MGLLDPVPQGTRQTLMELIWLEQQQEVGHTWIKSPFWQCPITGAFKMFGPYGGTGGTSAVTFGEIQAFFGQSNSGIDKLGFKGHIEKAQASQQEQTQQQKL